MGMLVLRIMKRLNRILLPFERKVLLKLTGQLLFFACFGWGGV